jgi:dihydropteroate synthase
MAISQKFFLKRMGVLNCTPNSFSDGGEISSSEDFMAKISSFGHVDALDLGAESTAPMNDSISWKTEWERLRTFLPLVKHFPGTLSIDTYHPETIEEVLRFYLDHALNQKLIWNDVSGKFDSFVRDFLSISPSFSYVFSHNLAPTREQTGRHMDFVRNDLSLEELKDYFLPFKRPQVIFDPCLGFSKTYEQNWMILNQFSELQELVSHEQWLVGFSRKSFLRKKFNLSMNQKEELDQVHIEVLRNIPMHGEIWIRSHRPELIP